MRHIVIINYFNQRDMRVNLAGRQARVAKARSDRNHGGAVLHHVGCERMAQAVRAHFLSIYARQSEPQFHHPVN